jgi:hypothetical protein
MNRTRLPTDKVMLQRSLPSPLRRVFRKFYGQFALTSIYWVECCPMYFIQIVRPFLTHLYYLQIIPFTWFGNKFTTGVTGRLRMFTPPMHVIPPLVYPGVLVCSIFWFVFSLEIVGLISYLYVNMQIYNYHQWQILRNPIFFSHFRTANNGLQQGWETRRQGVDEAYLCKYPHQRRLWSYCTYLKSVVSASLTKISLQSR